MSMLQKALEEVIFSHFMTFPLNAVAAERALDQACVGIKLFDAPLIAYGDPRDALFSSLKDHVIGEHFILPAQWCPKAKTVISIFVPHTQEVVNSNATDRDYPSKLWLHGRYEGQQCLEALAKKIEKFLQNSGFETICPCLSKDFKAITEGAGKGAGEGLSFTSNWSERHVAFVCGLGTFGLSKGIITQKGMAGRLISLVTAANFVKTIRPYTDIYEYCSCCGACIKRCPVQAISLEKGKEHIPCSRFIDAILAKEAPRYACGKCQNKVPCSREIPKKII